MSRLKYLCNLYLAVYDNCCLLTYLYIQFGSLYCKHYDPRSDCSIRSSLIRVHSVCFHAQKWSEMHLNICNRPKSRQLLQDKTFFILISYIFSFLFNVFITKQRKKKTYLTTSKIMNRMATNNFFKRMALLVPQPNSITLTI